MSFLFKNYSLVKAIYRLIRCYKTRLILIKNGVNKQNTYTYTHTHTEHSEKDYTGKA